MCKLCKFKKRKERDARFPDRIRKMDLKAKYGLTLDEYNTMHANQRGMCAICRTEKETLVVDHNHVTGKVRRLLCGRCNTMLGYAREDVGVLLSATAYLLTEEHGEEISGIEHLISLLRRHTHLLERRDHARAAAR